MNHRRTGTAIGFALGMTMLGLTPSLHGDEILLGRIPLAGVSVRGVKDCQVIYTMAGRPANRPVDRVVLHLDAMPDLEKAETAAAEGRLDEAMTLLDRAMQQAKEPWHKSWVHYRRVRLLNDAGRYTRACGAWATLLVTSIDPCWVDAMPTCEPDRPSEAMVSAALTQLGKALEVSQANSIARDMIDLAIRTISNLETTESTPTPESPTRESDPGPEAPIDAQPKDITPALPAPGVSVGRTVADDIDDLLDAGQLREARREIEKWVAEPKKYPLDRLLYQYGRVLAAEKEPRDAAVRFMQCAILYAESPHAAPSLFETARLYAGPLNNLAVARRLLDRAQATAQSMPDPTLLDKIRAALSELNSRK